MGLINKLLIAGATGIILKGISNSRYESEMENRRRNQPCKFTDELSENCFEEIAIRAVKRLKKKKIHIEVYGAKVYGIVESQTALTEWNFTIDFNDYGELTGAYWIWTENDDSIIPNRIAEIMQEEIDSILA